MRYVEQGDGKQKRSGTEQENSCSLQRSFLSEDRLTVRISANDLFRKYRHYTDLYHSGRYPWL